MCRHLVMALSLFLLPLFTLAVPTGLNMMPTAESLGVGSTRVEVETAGSGKMFVPTDDILYGTQIGFLLGIEGGVDQISGEGTRYNAKWVFKGEGLLFPALGVGIQNVASGEQAQYYAVATKSLLPAGGAKLHAGLMRAEGDNITMLGASGRLGPIGIKADRLNGGFRDGQALGVSYTINNFTITGTRYDFDNIPDENTLTISYLYRPLR